jgi:N6-adenosine-specific RNA methylase IME4
MAGTAGQRRPEVFLSDIRERSAEMTKVVAKRTNEPAISLPGKISRTGWQPPAALSQDDWLKCGRALALAEAAAQWWLGDWWVFGAQRKYGDGEEVAERVGVEYQTIRDYGSVARAYQLSWRHDNLTFNHHREAMRVEEDKRQWWLARALKGDGDGKPWSANQLRAAIKQDAAFQRTKQVEFDAKALGKFVVLYADPPWRYENPPMGGSNRSIENHYPTMDLDEICALPVGKIAHENSVLFMWATSPKLAECVTVLDAWGFNYRTDMVWVKDQIGMGYHVREKHESVLIAKRGELPPPAVEARPASVIEAPRLGHSEKPAIFYDIIDAMYPGVRKLELFGRAPEAREHWSAWGNQA